MIKIFFKRILFVLIIALMPLFFQNCGQNNEMLSQLSVANESQFNSSPDQSKTLCEEELMSKYKTGFHTFLRKNCKVCHDGSGNVEAPGFANAELNESFKVFDDIGYTLVTENAINDAHNPPYTGSKHINETENIKSEWKIAVENYLSCSGGSAEDKSVQTVSKSLMTVFENKTKASYWGTLNWSLNNNNHILPNQILYPIDVKIESQVAKINGADVGFAFRKPTFKVNSGTEKYLVKGLYFYINNNFQTAATVYKNLDVIVCSSAESADNLEGNSQLIVIPEIKATDQVALQLGSVEKVGDNYICGKSTSSSGFVTEVSFKQLISTDTNLGVFKKYCLNCHQGSDASAGLDLSSYNSAKMNANKILNRINDSIDPMPVNGLMAPNYRSVVEAWVRSGSPE